ncbi:hypothetical protein, partial [Sutterella massiliensis]|uniref:hypothetical protein n=1 Tax=Sutterella massiliensis TaxID=1816689 RepID=UPI00195F9E3B
MADKIVRRGKPVSLGNGSEVTVDIAVYDTQKGKGHRVEKITVHNLVEYIRDEKLPEVREDVTAPFEVSPHTPVTPPKTGPGVPW